MKAAVHLLCGKVCSGKSHYAKSLAAELGAITLSMDELMLSLFDERLGANHDLVAARSKAYLVPPGRPAERSGPARGAGLRSLDPG